MANINHTTYPVVPLRDMVMFPRMIVTIYLGRAGSVAALKKASEGDNRILLVAQKDASKENPKISDLYKVGVVAKVLQTLKLHDSNIKVLVEGGDKCEVVKFSNEEDHLIAKVRGRSQSAKKGEPAVSENDLKIMHRSLLDEFSAYVRVNKKISSDILSGISQLKEMDTLCNAISAHMPLLVAKKQEILEISDVYEQMENLLAIIKSEIDFIKAGERINRRVQNQIATNQRKYFLDEQLKAIYAEMGEGNVHEELSSLQDSARKSGMPAEVKKRFDTELQRLKSMSPMSSEANISRTYLDWLKDIPWNKKSKLVNSIEYAEKVMNEDHYGLEKVKDRVLEYLAVSMRTKKSTGTIICFVGPPGVGKTSLARSIARATGREYGKISLGGVRDEAEIRGHRRTYVGAMPGRVVQLLKRLGTSNPVILLDEIDKIGSASDYRGDPSAALLDILDPEQNKSFSDNYIEVDIDLSNILFVCTANSLNISRPLLDRMEVMRLSGYVEEEKIKIATEHLIPKQYALNGIDKNELLIENSAIEDVVRYYTRESGVRSLEREISKIMRKGLKKLITSEASANNDEPQQLNPESLKEVEIVAAARKFPEKHIVFSSAAEEEVGISKKSTIIVSSANLREFLGNRSYNIGLIDKRDLIGVCNGLAYTEVGGDLLPIEVLIVPGKGNIKTTGKLGEVMRESILTAWTHIKYRCAELRISPEYFEKHDCHVHVPEGAVPKDGPSAGTAIATAIISSITNIPIRRDVAMTGEITLHGKVLPIGGLKEKVLAAVLGGVSTVFIPEENVKDLEDVPVAARSVLEFVPVVFVDEIWGRSLLGSIHKHNNNYLLDIMNKNSDSLPYVLPASSPIMKYNMWKSGAIAATTVGSVATMISDSDLVAAICGTGIVLTPTSSVVAPL